MVDQVFEALENTAARADAMAARAGAVNISRDLVPVQLEVMKSKRKLETGPDLQVVPL